MDIRLGLLITETYKNTQYAIKKIVMQSKKVLFALTAQDNIKHLSKINKKIIITWLYFKLYI